MKIIICIFFVSTSIVYSQDVTTTGVPFLLISPSPEANGMAGISSAIPMDDPIAIITNPAQLGLMSLDRYTAYSMYASKTQWLPKFNLLDLTYDAKAGMVGVTSDDVFPLPVTLSLGAAYSRVYLNLGDIQQTGSGGPEVIGTFHSYEVSDAFSLALGAESIVKFGIGFTLKRIKSNLGPFGTEQEEGAAQATVSAYDFGLLLNVPVFRLLDNSPEQSTFSFIPGTNSALDISLAYAKSNIGDDIKYPSSPEPDPLPRYASVGYAIKYSIISTSTPSQDTFISLAFARQVEDVLVKRTAPDYTWSYQTGLGDINIYDGLIAGSRSKPVEILTGWRVTLYELLSLRAGRYNGTGSRYFQTQGYGIHLRGLWNLFAFFNPERASAGLLGYLREHVDGALHFSEYRVEDDHPLTGTQFVGFIISFR